ncbi:MAG: hypothetical protein LQ346_002388 [Caloplaca aetnensis]|nr:MAG: hypothetical protein LQ346_002388 [Caloplaca aetnensis]
MADYDRVEQREVRESPFHTLAKQVAGLNASNDETAPHEEAEDEAKVVDVIESLCINCEENGETRLLLTKIPYFREIILMSFSCPHCNFSNTDIQSAGQIQERGAKYSLKVTEFEDMERQIVKSDTAVFRLEDLDIEMPPGHGQLTNIEGILLEILKDLESGQRQRKKDDPEIWEKVDAVVQSLLKISLGQKLPFTITLDDPSGNSWIEPSSSDREARYQKSEYARTPAQNASLGLGEAEEASAQTEPSTSNGATAHIVPQIPTDADGTTTLEDVDILAGQTYSLPTPCPGCTRSAHLNLQLLNIPYFKEVIVSAVMCTECNYRSSDVKTGGEVPAKGKKIFLQVREQEDLRRDILKSESCCVTIPEVGVEVQPGTMGGRFTTVEGLLTQIRDDLKSTLFDVDDEEGKGGDSMTAEKKDGWDKFFKMIEKAIKGDMEYTILLEDPLANSYVQSLTAPDPDPRIREEEYERSAECDEDLGITDMRTRMGKGGEYEREVIGERLIVSGEGAAEPGDNVEQERAKAAETIKQATAGNSDSGSSESTL